MPEKAREPGRRIIGTSLRRGLGLLAGLGLASLAAAQATVPEPAPAEGLWAAYEFGRGLRLGDTGLTVGGYLTGEFSRPRDTASQARLSHASVFVWWEPHAALKLLGEFDQTNVLVRRRNPQPVRPGGPGGGAGGALGSAGVAEAERTERRFSLERLHLSWTFDDTLTLRGGKFLTPVGRWNLLHADPLVWTIHRPLLTQSVYPHNVTGLMASGLINTGAGALDYALYASNGREWRPDPDQDPFSRVRGTRLVWKPGDGPWQLGASYARYEQQGSRGEPRSLQGLDLHWADRGWALSAEWLHTRNRQRGPVQPQPQPGPPREDRPGMRVQVPGVPARGSYLQAVAPLQPRLWAVARAEWIRDALAEGTLRQTTLGLAWRPHQALSFKLEHQWVRWRGDSTPEGWAASASLLF